MSAPLPRPHAPGRMEDNEMLAVRAPPSALRSYTASERSREMDSRRPPLGEKASCVTVSVCASSGGPTGAHVAVSHSHIAAKRADCACAAAD